MEDHVFEQAEQQYSERLAQAGAMRPSAGLHAGIMDRVRTREPHCRWQDYFVLSVFRPMIAAASVAAVALAVFLLYSEGSTVDSAHYFAQTIIGGSASLML